VDYVSVHIFVDKLYIPFCYFSILFKLVLLLKAKIKRRKKERKEERDTKENTTIKREEEHRSCYIISNHISPTSNQPIYPFFSTTQKTPSSPFTCKPSLHRKCPPT
jgi:hypothetical protein